ncbi:NB-ARC domain-containing protein [Streptomyces sp. NPDC089919]|uniref:ATP-binding protein n=1 Tax=Streptomyces sp. NPDC089919 TaxID=3155188 RepID=UPI003416CA5C
MDAAALVSFVGPTVWTVTSGVVSGITGDVGRRLAERMGRLARRAGDDGGAAALPTDDAGRAELTRRLCEGARASPEFARELEALVREARGLEAGVPARVVRPRMLPPGTAAFTDREAVRSTLEGFLAEHTGRTAPPVLLTGPGGIGKSATAVHLGHALEEHFPDGQLYADLLGGATATALSPAEVLGRFLERLGESARDIPPDEARRGDLFRDRMAGRRMLVLLDNAHSPAQVEPLLVAAPGTLTLVTSRHRLEGLVGRGARPIALGPLSADDSLRLLGRIAGPDRISGAAAESGARAVAARCGGIPLALCTTGARVAVREHLTWQTVDRQLGGGPGGLEGVRATVDEDVDPVRAVTEATYAELSERGARVYRLAAAWDWAEVTVPLAARAADLAEDEARALLAELAEVHLLEEVAEERYRYHDLVRRHARDRAEAADGPRAMAGAVRRVVTWYLGFAAEADLRVIPGRWRLGPAYARPAGVAADRDPELGRTALAALRRERHNLAAAVRAAEQYGFDDLVWQLCEALWGLHLRLGFHEQWVDTHLRGVEAARRCAEAFGDPRAEGRMLTQLGFAYLGQEKAAEAAEVLERAAAADERAGHHRGRASAIEARGLLSLKLWRYEDAERRFAQAQEVLGRIAPGEEGAADLPRALALLEAHRGRALCGQERWAEAAETLHGALTRFREVGDGYNTGRVYMSLGETRLDAGEAAIARVCLDRAVETMEKEGAALQLGYALELRAGCARALAEPAAEAADLALAAGVYEAAGDARSLARVRARAREVTQGPGTAG